MSSHSAFGGPFACIVGAPRTGTTSLARYLRKHPSVCFSSVKEPHFFSQNDLAEATDEELRDFVGREYLDRYFGQCTDDGPLLMEGSVSYLYVPDQMGAILRLWPDAKFIIGVRDPMQMIPSLHQRLLTLGDENVRDFNQAWKLVDARTAGRRIPRTCADPRWLRYDEAGRLGHYVGAFLEAVGRERCLISVYDDLAADPAGQYRAALDFLGLPDDHQTDFSPQRTSQGFKIGWLQRLLKRPPVITRRVLAGEHYRQRVERVEKLSRGESTMTRRIMAARKRLLTWNKAPAPPIYITQEVRSDIRARLHADIEQLGVLIGRDLSHWLSETPTSR
ncbi:MAG: sulfotransferase [Sphingomicrobium sp.]